MKTKAILKLLSLSSLSLITHLTLQEPLHAQPVLWDNDDLINGGDWHDPNNWSGGALPTVSNEVRIDNGGLALISDPDAITRAFYVGYSTTNNRLSLVGQTLTTRAGNIGFQAGSSGYVTIGSGATWTTAGSGNPASLAVGGSGQGFLNIEQGGTMISGATATRIAQSAGGRGEVMVHGLWENKAPLAIGHAGIGLVTIGSGGTLDMGDELLVLGAGTNAIGILNIGGKVTETGTVSTAEAAGQINASTIRGGSTSGSGGTGVVNFNHTHSRYEFASSDNEAIVITGNPRTSVVVHSGTTVLSGANTYRGGTIIHNGTLLANYTGSETDASSTGTDEVTVQSGGTLGGIGNVGGDTLVNGILSPGDLDQGYGVLSFTSDLTLASTSETQIRINGMDRGTQYDALNIAGSLVIDGTLILTLNDGLELTIGENFSFLLFDASSISGSFQHLDLQTEFKGLDLNWDASQLYSDGIIQVTAIPEPATITLLFLFVIGIGYMRKMRSTHFHS